ncbi:hypothetical protein Ac2012v2_006267 [Leucoagaricus gongylophorus]
MRWLIVIPAYCDTCSQLKSADRPLLTHFDRLEQARTGTHLRLIMTHYMTHLATLELSIIPTTARL